jgi:hypothetical protein
MEILLKNPLPRFMDRSRLLNISLSTLPNRHTTFSISARVVTRFVSAFFRTSLKTRSANSSPPRIDCLIVGNVKSTLPHCFYIRGVTPLGILIAIF